MNEFINKYRKELLLFIIFILIGVISHIFLSFTTIIIFSLFFLFLVYNIFKVKATVIRVLLMIYFLLDLMLLLTARLNEKYLLIYIVTCAIILIALSKTEGINGLKRGGVLFAMYTVIKLIYLMFLIN